ncbi:MAG TPA: RHS repeat-associated core domain-containing protein [Caulobacter sp.]|nr:RHS repeat-associated core domain-containing protein [Caulobacter sp.]
MRRVLSAAKAFLSGARPLATGPSRAISAAVVLAAAALVLLTPQLAAAQAAAPPVRSSIDENGVDVTSGMYRYSAQEVAIGQPGAGGLTYQRDFVGDGWRDNLTGTIQREGYSDEGGWNETGYYIVSFGATSERFQLTGGVFVQAEGSQSTLTFDSGTQKYTYNNSGVVMVFDRSLNSHSLIHGVATSYYGNEGRITSITYPTGEAVTFHYKIGVLSDGATPAHRLQSVTNNLGYHVKFTYARNTAPTTGPEQLDWFRITSVTGINGAVDYCDPSADSCTYSVTWPTATYAVPSSGVQEVTDTLSRTTKYYTAPTTQLTPNTILTGIRRPTSPSANSLTVAYDSLDRVSSVSNGIGTWTYGYSDSAGVFTTTKTDPLSKVWTYKSESETGLLLSEKDPLNRETLYAYDDKGRLTKVTRPEGDSDEYTYDARGNVTEVRRKAKPGSGLTDIVTTASYPSTCSNAITCNKPASTTNANGKTTDYTYDSTHGGVLTVTAPPPAVSGTRPQTRYSYTALYAWYKNSSGTIVQGPSSVYKLTGTSACATGSSCAAAANELKTTITYGAVSTANNLLPTSVATGSGNGALTATTAYSYNNVGDVIAVDGPLSGSADTVSYRYDAGRQRIGVTAPDPDGATVALKHRASRTTYNADGQPTLVEQGTVNSTSDGDWALFSTLTKQAFTYDSVGRTTKATVESGATTYAVTQLSYDNANRIDCVAVRMNSFTSLPAACTHSTAGANGPDAISKNSYDAAGQLIKVTTGYGTAAQRDEASASYSANGLQTTLADAKGNLTTFQYDGFNRPWKVFYPHPTTPTTSSATDYEQYTYDASGRLSQERRRNGETFAVTYDDLNRPTTVDVPTGMLDVSYTYDNFGRMLTQADSSQTLTSTYDILGRRLSETGPLGTVAYEYDLAGQRTKLTWPDSYYVTYEYDNAGNLNKIKQNGSGTATANIATYSYNNRGMRHAISRANGFGTSFTYDAVSRLTSLVQNSPVNADDVTYTLTWNPAFQVKTRTGSNSSYALSGLSAVDRPYTANGLNQMTESGALDLTYDAAGNLTSDGVNTYSYDQANRLTGMPSVVSLSYDPAGRLYQVAGTATTKFLYDGVDLIAEYDSAGENVLRKYVHGPDWDEPLVWLEGSGTSDRRWLITDQIGSIVAVTDSTGAAINVNKYDEYGVPASGNSGRFQYTGQSWLADLGLYNYKARAYSSNIGRFLQGDPIGYSDGTNLYEYVFSDPVNNKDPLGLAGCPNTTVASFGPGDDGDVEPVDVCGANPPPYACDEDWFCSNSIPDGYVIKVGGVRGQKGSDTDNMCSEARDICVANSKQTKNGALGGRIYDSCWKGADVCRSTFRAPGCTSPSTRACVYVFRDGTMVIYDKKGDFMLLVPGKAPEWRPQFPGERRVVPLRPGL